MTYQGVSQRRPVLAEPFGFASQLVVVFGEASPGVFARRYFAPPDYRVGQSSIIAESPQEFVAKSGNVSRRKSVRGVAGGLVRCRRQVGFGKRQRYGMASDACQSSCTDRSQVGSGKVSCDFVERVKPPVRSSISVNSL